MTKKSDPPRPETAHVFPTLPPRPQSSPPRPSASSADKKQFFPAVPPRPSPSAVPNFTGGNICAILNVWGFPVGTTSQPGKPPTRPAGPLP